MATGPSILRMGGGTVNARQLGDDNATNAAGCMTSLPLVVGGGVYYRSAVVHAAATSPCAPLTLKLMMMLSHRCSKALCIRWGLGYSWKNMRGPAWQRQPMQVKRTHELTSYVPHGSASMLSKHTRPL